MVTQPKDMIPFFIDERNTSISFNQFLNYDASGETIVVDIFGSNQLVNMIVRA